MHSKFVYICNACIIKFSMNIQDTVDYHISSTQFAMRRMYNLLATESGITHGIGSALTYIGKEGVPATKIAPMMGMNSSSLSRLLKVMEETGLIYRKHDTNDKRVVMVFCTDAGFALREKVNKAIIDFNKRLLKRINPDDLKAFVRVNNEIKAQVKEDVAAFQEKLNINNSK